MNRKNRLQKGIASLDEQIKRHEEKMKLAEELGSKELVGYYQKEIEALEERRKNRQEALDR
ncbi:MAG: hypothetical protein HY519_01675 [Candidatus Aenigmarchaeota archaeon]|nr:hypothetical protein [Candidatus Aenigmarchaeota archaeon]